MSSKYSKEQHLKINQAAWDEAHRFMAARRKKIQIGRMSSRTGVTYSMTRNSSSLVGIG